MTPRPPIVLRFFARFVPADLREPIAGDLAEEYLVMRDRRGPARATLWLWGQAARLALTFRWERATHGRPLPPIGDELRSMSHMWDSLRQDVGFGVRMLRRQPGFTAVALIALALGIGANTAIFSVVDAVLWRPLPYARRRRHCLDRRAAAARGTASRSGVARRLLRLAARRSLVRRDGGVRRDGACNLTGAGRARAAVAALAVSPAFLSVLGVAPALGRDFRAEEETVGRHRVVLLTDALWRRRFGADSAIVGRTLSFDGNPTRSSASCRRRFWWPTAARHRSCRWRSTMHDRALRAAHFLDVVARRRPGDFVRPGA